MNVCRFLLARWRWPNRNPDAPENVLAQSAILRWLQANQRHGRNAEDDRRAATQLAWSIRYHVTSFETWLRSISWVGSAGAGVLLRHFTSLGNLWTGIASSVMGLLLDWRIRCSIWQVSRALAEALLARCTEFSAALISGDAFKDGRPANAATEYRRRDPGTSVHELCWQTLEDEKLMCRAYRCGVAGFFGFGRRMTI